MREHSLRPIGTAVWAACASKLYICVFFLCVASLRLCGHKNVAVIPWGTGGLRSLFQMGADHVEADWLPFP